MKNTGHFIIGAQEIIEDQVFSFTLSIKIEVYSRYTSFHYSKYTRISGILQNWRNIQEFQECYIIYLFLEQEQVNVVKLQEFTNLPLFTKCQRISSAKGSYTKMLENFFDFSEMLQNLRNIAKLAEQNVREFIKCQRIW